MKLYHSFEMSAGPTAVALGYFDGVHLAHQQVIKTMTSFEKDGFIPTVLTFHMDQDIPKKSGMKTILTDNEKLDVFQDLGVKQVYMPPFSQMIDYDATDFFYQVLVKQLQAKVLVCGYDYAFGKNAQGDAALLSSLCNQNDIRLVIIEPYELDGQLISSTYIRELLSEGNIEKTNQLLGFSYFIKGQVSYGNQIGKTLGFPTANIVLSEKQVMPKYGVYETRTIIDNVSYKSITNVGVKPTIDGERNPLSETHILGFNENLYNKDIKICFIRMLRAEQKFLNLGQLRQAIQNDIETIK